MSSVDLIEADGGTVEPLRFGPARPEDVFDWDSVGIITSPDQRGKLVPVATNAFIEFKSLKDASACELRAGTRSPSLTIDPRRCERVVRLLLRAPQLTSLLSALDSGSASVDVSATLDPASYDPPNIEWIALLVEDSSGARVFWKRLGVAVSVARAQTVNTRVLCSWSELEDARAIYLAVQFAPGSPPARLEQLALSVSSTLTPKGGLHMAADELQCWLRSGRETQASIVAISTDGVRLDVPANFERRLGEVRFTVPRRELEAALVQAGAKSHDYRLEMTIDGDRGAVAWAAMAGPPKSTVLAERSRAPRPAPRPSPVASGEPPVVDVDLLTEQLRGAADVDAIRAGMSTLYSQRHDEAIWALYAEISAPGSNASTPLRAYVLFYYARRKLDINAAETAYVVFDTLLNDAELAATFAADEKTRLRKLFARACLRSGRIEQSALEQRDLLADNPVDWEPYFQLGMMQSAADVDRRRFYHEAAEALSSKLPVQALTYLAEAYLKEGAVDQALVRTVRKLKSTSSATELYLTLANINLHVGNRREWARYIETYFVLNGLSSPPFLTESPHAGHIFDIPAQSSPPQVNSDEPLVTVVMTCFNAAATIQQAARSVLAQSHTNLRLVIVDDVSSDGSREIIESLKREDARVASIYNTDNVGTYCAKNRGLLEFESDYYTFHDSDDWMHPERITEHLQVLTTQSDIKFCTSYWFRMDEFGHTVVRRGGGYLHENPASTFFHASLLKEVGYFDSVRTGADTEFTWRVRRRLGLKSTTEIRKPLAIGLHHAASLTQSGASAYDEHRFSPVRLQYSEEWVNWHERALMAGRGQDLFVPFPLPERTFAAPSEIMPQRETPPG